MKLLIVLFAERSCVIQLQNKKVNQLTWLTKVRWLHFCGSPGRCFLSRAVWHRSTVASSSVLERLKFSGNGCGGVLLGRGAAKGGQFVACLTSEERLDGERWFKWLLHLQLCLELRLVSLRITQAGWCRPRMTATLEIAEVMFCIVRLHFHFLYQTVHDARFNKVMTEMRCANSLVSYLE